MNNSDKQKIERDIKNTVGYNEADNKKDFMVGASVAISKLEAHYESLISSLNIKITLLTKTEQELYDDLTTLTTILNKYK